MRSRRGHAAWLRQLVTISDKGAAAYAAGQPLSANPYKGGYRNSNGAGGQVQRLRRSYWAQGWKLAEEEAKEKT